MPRIDLNADVGEGFGAWAMGSDAELLALVTSANVACGFHAGDPAVMDRTVGLAVRAGVALGAHPGHADLRGFGRRAIQAAADDIEKDVLYQVGALQAFARAHGTRVVHVKPHGALYNQAAEDETVARAIVRGVARAGRDLILVGLASTEEPGSVLTDPAQAAAQAVKIATEGRVIATDGREIALQADTLCLHGDNPAAVANAAAVRHALESAGVAVQPLVV